MEKTSSKLVRGRTSIRSLRWTLHCIMILFCLSGAHGMSYVEIEKLGNVCPILDSCAHRGVPTYGKEMSSFRDRSCNCDLACTEYGDCCVDAWKSKSSRNNLNCRQVEQVGGVYMIDTCPLSYKGPDEVRQRCEKTDIGSQADPLGSMPVTDPQTGLTYKNYYCKICDSKSDDNVVMWTPKLECPLLSLMNDSGTITKDYVLRNLVTDGYSWGLYLNDEEDGSSFFHDCRVHPVPPSAVKAKIRLCKPGLISNCPTSWDRQEIRTMCNSYTGARFDREGRGYRNVHCAICNSGKLGDLSCRSFDDLDIFREFGTHSFAVLLDISRATGEQVGRIRICKAGDVFDPFFQKCRGVLCLPGYVRRGRRCTVRNPVRSAMFLGRANKRIFMPSTTPKYQEDIENSTVLVQTPESLNTTLMKA